MEYEAKQRVSFLQIDGGHKMTATALLCALQEMAILHSDSLGYTISYMREQGWFWSVVNWHLNIYRMPQYNETITLQTWNDKFARFQANRSFAVYDAEGNRIVDAMSRWVFMDTQTRKPTNIPADMPTKYYSEKEAAIKDEKFLMPKEPEGALIAERMVTVTRRDTDTNHHANNVKYLEWGIDEIPDEIYDGMELKEIRMVYRRECKRGDNICVKTYSKDTQTGKTIETFLYEGKTLVAQMATDWA